MRTLTTIPQLLSSRPVVFAVAFLSFACLLGQFFGFWTMHFFGCWVLPPATALLVYVAYQHRGRATSLSSPYTWSNRSPGGSRD